jgi:serine/threonine protein kinase
MADVVQGWGPAPGAVVAGRYRLVRLLGVGGMGVVWEAWDERLHRSVAVKLLHVRPGLSPEDARLAERRAIREARLAARLQHRHAVGVYDVLDHEGQPCLVMQLVPSESLSEVLARRGVLTEREVAHLGGQVASALATAHRLGIVHRDVKPGNVLIAHGGDALITDFGIAHAMGDATLTTTGMITGTPAYLAPEVARGAPSAFPSDVFSLGATLYAASEGAPPFGTDPNAMALLHRVASGHVHPPRGQGRLTSTLLDMLDPDPAARPSMADVASELEVQARLADRAQGHPWEGIATAPTVRLPPVADEAPARPAPVGGAEAPAALRTVEGSRTPTPSGPSRPRGGRAALAAAVLAVAVALAVLVGPWRAEAPGSRTTPVGRPVTASATSATPSGGSPASTTPEATSRASTGPPATATSATSATSATTVSPGRPPTSTELASAVSAYYALLPGGTADAWPRMTAGYQSGTAGGRASYDRFWSRMSRVTATDVQGRSPSTVTATVTYYRRDGSVVRERTSFRLVEDDGVLKIARSTVLGSRTL